MSMHSLFAVGLSFLFCLFSSVAVTPFAFAQQSSLHELETRSAHGDREAQNLLGTRYFSGDGVQKNQLYAAELFTRAARQGNPKAQFNLGYMYHNGIALPQDYLQACVWYQAAADQGYADAITAYQELAPYLDDETLKRVAELREQIPTYASTRQSTPDLSAHPSHEVFSQWLQSIHPAAGK